jgi:hypothetical protein
MTTTLSEMNGMPITIADFYSRAVLAARVNGPIAMHGFQKLMTMAELLAFEEECRAELFGGMILCKPQDSISRAGPVFLTSVAAPQVCCQRGRDHYRYV